MNRYFSVIIFVMALLWSADAAAQRYYVYAVRGDVSLVSGRTKTPLKTGQQLEEAQTVNIASGGLLMLLDKEAHKLHTVNRADKGTVKNLLAGDKVGVKDLTARYFRYLWNQMNSKSRLTADSEYMQRTTSAYRGLDSLCVETDTLTVVPADSIGGSR